jgi:hypothetical protein
MNDTFMAPSMYCSFINLILRMLLENQLDSDFLHAGGKAAKVIETFISLLNNIKKNEKRSRRDIPILCIYVVH